MALGLCWYLTVILKLLVSMENGWLEHEVRTCKSL